MQQKKSDAVVQTDAYSVSTQHKATCKHPHCKVWRHHHCHHHHHHHKTPSTAAPTTPRASTSSQQSAPPASSGQSGSATSASSTEPAAQTLATSTSQATGGVGTWVNEAFSILEAHGYSTSQLSASDVEEIIQNESGGNPLAINLSDSNAANGTPSEGLMQTIGPTFDAYALPGYSDIYNPVDNIIAGVRYAIATYGSLSQVPGVESLAAGGGYVGY